MCLLVEQIPLMQQHMALATRYHCSLTVCCCYAVQPADVGPSAPHMMDSEEERDHEAFRDQDHARRYEVGYVSDGSDDAADGARSGEDDDDGDDGDHNAGDGDGMHNHDGDDDGGVSCMDSDPDDEPLLKHYGSSFGSQDVAADRTQGEASTSSSSSSNSSRKTTWGSRSSSRQNVSAEQMSSIGRTSGLPYSSTSAGWWGSTPGGRRLLARYIGHCNVQTDIKESVFVGHGDQMVACGSDDGRVFIYDADTGVPVKVLDADDDVANCVQCHPAQPVLATSGIEQVVKLWSPLVSCSAVYHQPGVVSNDIVTVMHILFVFHAQCLQLRAAVLL